MFRGDVMYGHTGSVPKYTTNNDLILAPIACVVLIILALIMVFNLWQRNKQKNTVVCSIPKNDSRKSEKLLFNTESKKRHLILY